MEIQQAWDVLRNALDQGTMAAHGAGLIGRQDVQRINEAEQTVAGHLNALQKSNAELAEYVNKQNEEAAKAAAEKGEDCGCPDEDE